MKVAQPRMFFIATFVASHRDRQDAVRSNLLRFNPFLETNPPRAPAENGLGSYVCIIAWRRFPEKLKPFGRWRCSPRVIGQRFFKASRFLVTR
jgi:hypothetical protein